jgi:preprotein translocase subunit SecE
MTGMGFNPFRVQRRQTADYVLVVAAAVVILALVVWAAW